MTTEKHPRIPSATYRLQFNRWFTFSQAREIVPYLEALGVTDAYASPYFQAGAESLHGYDITDHNKLNAAIGSREEYDSWIAELQAHSMGQVLDFVPNHVGIAEPLNEWWMDVLENGPSSRYAPYFDIDWHPLKSDLRDKVLLPIMGVSLSVASCKCVLRKGRFTFATAIEDCRSHRGPIAMFWRSRYKTSPNIKTKIFMRNCKAF